MLPFPSRPYLICSIVLPYAFTTTCKRQMTGVGMSLLTGRLKREMEICEDKTLDNVYFRESKDKLEKEVKMLRAEKKSGHDSVAEPEEDFREESRYKPRQTLQRIHLRKVYVIL